MADSKRSPIPVLVRYGTVGTELCSKNYENLCFCLLPMRRFLEIEHNEIKNRLYINWKLTVFVGRPEYVGTWLGCCKIGVVPALINTSLRQEERHQICTRSRYRTGMVLYTVLLDSFSLKSDYLRYHTWYTFGMMRNGPGRASLRMSV